jgi:glycosyltransferase involved in cell wall biosynthesis
MNKFKKKIRILTMLDYYLPGYKAGGPVRTINYMVSQLTDNFEFWIITRDHDVADEMPYESISSDTWSRIAKANIYYVSEERWTIRNLARLIQSTQYDILYLNSFFSSWTTILPLFMRFFGKLTARPIVLAPRGEFSPGALKLKRLKKKVFLNVLIPIGFYNNIIWQASSHDEACLIRAQLSKYLLNKPPKSIFVAPNILPIIKPNEENIYIKRIPGPKRIIFLSRITPKKNLEFLISIISKISTEIEFSIYGPVDNYDYWNRCKESLSFLPPHIKIHVNEAVVHERVREVFSAHDLFLFPTSGENFGHVIFESLSAGTPVMVSDQVFWKSDKFGSLQVLPLDHNTWVTKINSWIEYSDEELNSLRKGAYNYACNFSSNSNTLKMNRELFFCALGLN